MTEAELRDLLDRLGGWEGFAIAAIRTEPVGNDVFGAPAPRLVLVLQPTPGHPRRCSQCGRPVEKLHDVTVRRVRDLPFGEWDTWLEVPRARLRCPTCGPIVEAVPWLDRYQRMTTRLVEKIARLAQVLPIKQVAAWFGVGWDAVQEIDRRALGARLGAPEDHLDGIRRIAVDAFALHRGHAYATVVLDLERKRVSRITHLYAVGDHPVLRTRGDAYAKTLVERVIGLCKSDASARQRPWRGLDPVEFQTLVWVAWCNQVRLLSTIGYLAPAAYEVQFNPAPVGTVLVPVHI